MNRLNYDANTYQFDLKQSVGPGVYALGTPIPHCSPCFANDTRMHMGTSGGAECAPEAMTLIDANSELLGLTRPATNCPTGLYLPWKYPVCAQVNYRDCQREGALPLEDTRLSNPPCTLRCTGWNRFEWLCQDPQARVLVPFDNLINVRTITKDNHRPFIARPLDQSLALPPAKFDAPDAGPPAWSRESCTSSDGQRRTFDEPPIIQWRTCGEVARAQYGCASSTTATCRTPPSAGPQAPQVQAQIRAQAAY
jgi:hypothetical protein